MRIAVNTRLLLKGKLEGIGRFSCETLKRIVQQHPEHTFLFFFDRSYSEEFIFGSNVVPVILQPQARHPLLWYLYFQMSTPYALQHHKADIYVSPDGYIPLNTGVKTVNVIHDINFEHNPEYLRFDNRIYCRKYFPKFAREATQLVTVSEFSKQDIVDTYGIAPEKIHVVYNGPHTAYHTLPENEQQTVREQYSNGCPFFVFVGALHPRKNVVNLLKAFDRYKDLQSNTTKLLIVGAPQQKIAEMEATFRQMKHKADVVFTGRLQPDELNKVMSSAEALTFPSFFEGFGIPIVEAFASGTPVITSNTSSMPEVAGDAAILVNPHSVEEIAQAMHTITTNPELKAELVEKGRNRLPLFDWDRSANQLWNVIESVF